MKLANTFFFLAIMSFAGGSNATPILEQGIGSTTPYAVTILPDDNDQNLFYFFPNHLGLAALGNKKAFSCSEKKSWLSGSSVDCNMIFEAVISPDTIKKMEEIKVGNAQAKFSPMPYSLMSIGVSTSIHPYLKAVECQPFGAETGQQVSCNWSVHHSQFRAFRRLILDNALVEVMHYSASYIAIGAGQKLTVPFAIPIYVANLGQGDYFYDYRGNTIK